MGLIIHFPLTDIYDEKFFEGIDAVTNALDNIKARKWSSLSLFVSC